ncbi:hypothetical protein EDB81DRAFT_371509 [Dactylonectria macrodidyma]|uniref:Uncharacterized protein n=1 Tax=Dactylonectria macrodidyma TaxID=307937 RepID=A0A9P9I797_9HYPO|nr:hypothetical protein EDB81DRAFT_371509 [Dactylonectria macrodidyma]
MTKPETPSPFETPQSTPESTPTPSAFALLRRQAQARKTVAQQLDELSIEAIPAADDVQSLPRLNVKGRLYILEDWAHKKGGRLRTTWIKDHGVFLLEVNPDGTTNLAQWLCRACDKMGSPVLFQHQASTSAIAHLSEYISLLYLGLY